MAIPSSKSDFYREERRTLTEAGQVLHAEEENNGSWLKAAVVFE